MVVDERRDHIGGRAATGQTNRQDAKRRQERIEVKR
jgi:hypothetical protein